MFLTFIRCNIQHIQAHTQTQHVDRRTYTDTHIDIHM